MNIPAGEFKVTCLKLMDQVRDFHEEIVITKYGKPVAKLVGVTPQTKEPLFGFLKDSVVIKGDIISPLEEPWDAQNSGR